MKWVNRGSLIPVDPPATPGKDLAAVNKESPTTRRLGDEIEVETSDPLAKTTSQLERWSRRIGPLLVVAIAVAYGLVELRAETTTVSYLDDASVHAQMARWAGHQLANGHLPLDGWWPYLGLGSPQFLHYQSLSSIITGALGLAVGQAHAFAWLLYLLVATWPISVYLSARLFRLSPWVAASAALVSPLIVSNLGIGYEQKTYLWIGFGLTTQLWAMWTLPLAWGATWRALEQPQRKLSAVVLISITVALHFMTGYLAIIPIILFPFLVPSELRRRLKEAILILAGTAACAGIVIVPVLWFKHWASVNEFLANSPTSQSYGARPILSWLVHGSLLDYGRLPVITILAAVGALGCLASWRKDRRGRPLVVMFLISLILFFGQPFLGPLTRLVPGSEDLFLRRFLMGVQLASIMFAGIGIVLLGTTVRAIVRYTAKLADIKIPRSLDRRWGGRAVAMVGVILICAGLYPAWHSLAVIDSGNANDITYQANADVNDGGSLQILLNHIKAVGGGRVYAGLPTNWGATFTVGTSTPMNSVTPVFKWLEQDDIPEVGYTMRTASLMTDPEAYFDESIPGDYKMFGIRWLILPATSNPLVPAKFVMTETSYSLWEIPTNGYVQVVDTQGTITSDRTDIGARSVAFMQSGLSSSEIYPTVAYGGSPAAPPTLAPGQVPQGSPGSVISQSPDLTEGELSTVVRLNRPAVVVLSASYDPGWTVTVDGRPAKTEMIAPALVGVTVGVGTHKIRFLYQAFPYYPELFAIALIALMWLWLGPTIATRRKAAKAARPTHQ